MVASVKAKLAEVKTAITAALAKATPYIPTALFALSAVAIFGTLARIAFG